MIFTLVLTPSDIAPRKGDGSGVGTGPAGVVIMTI
jgi:hypothetical protein